MTRGGLWGWTGVPGPAGGWHGNQRKVEQDRVLKLAMGERRCAVVGMGR